MTKINRLPFFLFTTFCCLVFISSTALASEPGSSKKFQVFEDSKESKINYISKLSSSDAFEELIKSDSLLEEEFLEKAVYKTFELRREDGIALSLRKIELSKYAWLKIRETGGSKDVFLARKILEAYPGESVPILLDHYRKGDAVTKGNVIRVSGKLPGNAIDRLLIDALDDKTFCEMEDPEVDGPAMRICDLAYNELVRRYRIKNVLRAIGPIYRIETRDYHIAILKGKF